MAKATLAMLSSQLTSSELLNLAKDLKPLECGTKFRVQLEVAQQHAGGSINDVTDNLTIDALCGTAAFNGTWVVVDATN